jgi:hypothetical protein
MYVPLRAHEAPRHHGGRPVCPQLLPGVDPFSAPRHSLAVAVTRLRILRSGGERQSVSGDRRREPPAWVPLVGKAQRPASVSAGGRATLPQP